MAPRPNTTTQRNPARPTATQRKPNNANPTLSNATQHNPTRPNADPTQTQRRPNPNPTQAQRKPNADPAQTQRKPDSDPTLSSRWVALGCGRFALGFRWVFRWVCVELSLGPRWVALGRGAIGSNGRTAIHVALRAPPMRLRREQRIAWLPARYTPPLSTLGEPASEISGGGGGRNK